MSDPITASQMHPWSIPDFAEVGIRNYKKKSHPDWGFWFFQWNPVIGICFPGQEKQDGGRNSIESLFQPGFGHPRPGMSETGLEQRLNWISSSVLLLLTWKANPNYWIPLKKSKPSIRMGFLFIITDSYLSKIWNGPGMHLRCCNGITHIVDYILN